MHSNGRSASILAYVFIGLIFGYWLGRIDDSKWVAFIYRDGSSYAVERIRGLNSLKECRAASLAAIETHFVDGASYEYECGYKCGFDEVGKFDRCKKSEQ